MSRPESIPFRDIARIVRDWPGTRGYGPHIAERFGVPIATARRWVYMTRVKGLLPSGMADRPCPTCDGTGVARWGNSTSAKTRRRKKEKSGE